MRSILSHIACFAAIAAVAASAPVTAHASEPADGNGTGLIKVVAAPPAVDHKTQVAEAKAAWKVAKAQAKQPAPATAAPFKLHVQEGALLVDGIEMKTRLNYTVDSASYLSFYLPGTGTVILSANPMAGATPVKSAIHGSVLAFAAAGHEFRLESETPLSNGNTVDAYVRVDTSDSAKKLGDYLLMGYGVMLQAPYTSSGSAASGPVLSASK